VDIKDTSKWFQGKPVNEHWRACNATLRTMKPEVHELDKRSTEDKEMLKYYSSTFGNARAAWDFTCDAFDFVQGVYARLSAVNASDIDSFTFAINTGGFEPPEEFPTLEAFVEAIKLLPAPPNAEPEPEAEPGMIEAMKEELQKLRDDVKSLQSRVAKLEE
jgi:hypothetical protein